MNVVELLRQTDKIAGAVVVGVEERLDVHLVDDRILVPERIVLERDGYRLTRHRTVHHRHCTVHHRTSLPALGATTTPVATENNRTLSRSVRVVARRRR